MRLFPSLVAVSALVLSLVVRPALPVAAASITVTTTNDELNTDSACSLREAIQAVNTASGVSGCAAGSGNDTILLPAGTYTLTIAGGNENNNATGDLDIFPTSSAVPRTLTIQGSGATTTVVDGNQLDRVFHLIDQNATLILRNLTVRNGRLPSAQNGAEVLSCGRLERYNVIIEGDATTGDNTGGAMSVVACASAVDLALVAATSRT
jgi:CSLREA domain-containing protein